MMMTFFNKKAVQFGVHVQKAPKDKTGKNIDSFEFLENHFKKSKK